MHNESRKNSLLDRHPFKTILSILLIIFILAEVTLRIAFYIKGYQVGNLVPYWNAFVEVDSLIERKQFYTDEKGIYKAYPPYWDDVGILLNRINFRGREFKPAGDSGKIKLLNIGDSFTWGAQANPLDSSFVDLLDKDERFISYNAGIPGTDPAQYLLVAQTYASILKPDFILVYFYLGNDLMDNFREIKPKVDLYYQTNAGWLPAFYKGRYFPSAKASYEFAKDRYVIKGGFKKLVSHTAIGTFLMALPLRIEEYITWKKQKQGKIPNFYLKEIQKVAVQINSTLLIFVIPNAYADLTEEYFDDRKQYVQRNYPRLFEGLEDQTYVLPMQPQHYYKMPDGHFNNEGHKVAAEIIMEKIMQ